MTGTTKSSHSGSNQKDNTDTGSQLKSWWPFITTIITIILAVVTVALTSINIVETHIDRLQSASMQLAAANKEEILREIADMHTEIRAIRDTDLPGLRDKVDVIDGRVFRVEGQLGVKTDQPLLVTAIFTETPLKLAGQTNINVALYNPNLYSMKDDCTIFLDYEDHEADLKIRYPFESEYRVKLGPAETQVLSFTWDIVATTRLPNGLLVRVKSQDCPQGLNPAYTVVRVVEPTQTAPATEMMPPPASTPTPH